jgi:HD-GYP domain-containing protein (c-di-GMP phosphodiesterase class II)
MSATTRALGYLPVATATLSAASALAFDLFIQRAGAKGIELYRERSYPISDEDFDRLQVAGIDHLYIRLDEADSYQQYLRENILHATGVPTPVRFRALRDLTRVAFEEAFRTGSCDSMVEVASGFGKDLAAMLSQHTPAFEELFKTLDHDFYTFTHACNVSTYCAVIAIRLEQFDALEIAEIAAGGLLHDIGKRHIPQNILNKAGKLSDLEWKLVRQHPITGFRELSQRSDLSAGQLMMVYQHHERLDGSGYPCGSRDDEIHRWASICAVADVFDAMTCKRPYRRALPVGEAYLYLRRMAGRRLNREVVECWSGPQLAAAT